MKNKLLFSILGVLAVSALVFGSTYAFLLASTEGEFAGDIESGLSSTLSSSVVYKATNLVPLNDSLVGTAISKSSNKCIDKNGYQVCSLYKLTLSNSSDSENLYGYVRTSDSTYTTDNLKYQVFDSSYTAVTDVMTISKDEGTTVYFQSNSSNYSVTSTGNIVYYLAIWLHDTGDFQDDDYSKTFNGYVGFESVEYFGSGTGRIEAVLGDDTGSSQGTLVSHITNLYLNNKDATLVTNNGIDYRYASIYDKDDDDTTSGGLMNDRQGSMDIGEDAGNIRYYGADPNNYIYFNCEDYSNQSDTTCEKWRIIGIVDGKVKIMRGSVLGNYSWDNKSSGIGSSTSSNGSNEWSDSRLMMLLNPGYDVDKFDSNNNLLNEHNRSYYWNSTGTSASPVKCYSGSSNATTNCYFDDKGIKNDTTRGLISESLWYLRGWNSSSVFSDQIYEYERTTGKVVNTTRSTTWTGKIAIPYPSDYGYAADFGSCNVNLRSYNNTLCTGVNWMKSIFTSNIWLFTPNSSYSNYAWYVYSSGHVRDSNYVNVGRGVVPVLYLNSELSTGAGDGSQNTPYQLAVN